MEKKLETYIKSIQKQLSDVNLTKKIEQLAKIIKKTAKADGTVFLAGNGGSSATAEHFTCDLTSLKTKAICLSDNTSILTATANDYKYADIFSKRLEVFAHPKDLLIVISASGNSPNIIKAIKTAKSKKLKTFGLFGFNGGKAKKLVDNYILIPSSNYKHPEDLHLIIAHATVHIL